MVTRETPTPSALGGGAANLAGGPRLYRACAQTYAVASAGAWRVERIRKEGAGMSIRQLLYISELSRGYEPGLLESIALRSTTNNEKRRVSGCLLYSKGHFLQLLEGPGDQIEELFGIISGDRRHKRIRMLHNAADAQRLFDGWEMRTYDLERTNELPPVFVARVLNWIELNDSDPLFLLHILDDFKNFL